MKKKATLRLIRMIPVGWPERDRHKTRDKWLVQCCAGGAQDDRLLSVLFFLGVLIRPSWSPQAALSLRLSKELQSLRQNDPGLRSESAKPWSWPCQLLKFHEMSHADVSQRRGIIKDEKDAPKSQTEEKKSQFAFNLLSVLFVCDQRDTSLLAARLTSPSCSSETWNAWKTPWNLLKRLKKTWDPSFRVPLSTKLRSVLLVAKSSWRSSLCRSFSFMRSSAAKAPLSQQMTAAAFFFSFFTWIHTYSYCFLLYLSNYQLINWIIY